MTNEDRLLQIELLKTKIQVNNEDAHAVLLYGTIPLGIVVFLLPILNVPTAPQLYWFGLLAGTLLAAFGAFGIISYSREQIAWSDRIFGTLFSKLVNGQIPANSSIIAEFSKDPPHFERKRFLFRLAKIAIKVGLTIYGLLFFYGMWQSLRLGTAFFSHP